MIFDMMQYVKRCRLLAPLRPHESKRVLPLCLESASSHISADNGLLSVSEFGQVGI